MSSKGRAERQPRPASGRSLAGPEKERPVDVLAGSLALFVLAGLCEIGGGYLVWQWWRSGASWILGSLGGLV